MKAGFANCTTYSHPLPRDLQATDSRKDVRDKLGKPNEADRRRDGPTELSMQLGERDASIGEVWVRAAPAKP